MSLLNLGVLAHVDAGKTSLTEHLLYHAGAIDAPGSVDRGTTRTDSLDVERRRGITVRAAVTSFVVGERQINLVDTPGHPDFIAEVERSLTVLDAAVLVVSAVEGVQAQTVVLWRALTRLRVPTLFFVNKIDRAGADVERVETQIRRRLTGAVLPLCVAEQEGTDAVRVEGLGWGGAEIDEVLHGGLRAGGAVPMLCGSAITGAGVAELASVLARLPVPAQVTDIRAPVAGTVFAVDRDGGQRRAWIRLWGGRTGIRDEVGIQGRKGARITQIDVSRPGGLVRATSAGAGEIVAVCGPQAAIGEVIGTPPRRRRHRFAPATLQALVEPVDPAQRVRLWSALAELADEDPLIGLRLDPHAGEAGVHLHGEVQREVIDELLRLRYGVETRWRPSAVICLERPVGTGEAVERIGLDANPYLATIGLRVEPLPVGRGVVFAPGIERGKLPAAFVAATEEGARAGLRHGLSGWAVTDIRITMTESAYLPRQSAMHQKFNKAMSSIAADFRRLAPVVLHAALARARTVVCEPIERFDLDVPEAAFPATAALLGRCAAVTTDSTVADGYLHLRGTVPTARVRELATRLPDLTGGEAVLVATLDHHAPVVVGPPPRRTWRGPDPGDRLTWFRDVPR